MSNAKTADDKKPLVLITGGAGNIGTALCGALRTKYRLISLDRHESDAADASHVFDLTSLDSVREAIAKIKAEESPRAAAVIHLAAYFDFTGEESPLYDKVNVEGTRNLLKALRDIEVERFIYSSTMLVHEPSVPGRKIGEESPLGPGWAYPKSKLETEEVVRRECGSMPYTILRLAGLYDEQTAVPTLSHQITRIYEKDLQSHFYPGDRAAGQALIHRDDMIDAFRRAVDRRNDLEKAEVFLIGEETAPSYEALQNRLGELIHGKEEWETLSIPAPLAKAGAWAMGKAEPLVPDDIDHGEKPFIRPFMVDMASDHYELDTSKARRLLGWRPRHDIMKELPALVDALKADPVAWYKANGINPPDWAEVADARGEDAHALKRRHDKEYVKQHLETIWAPFMNMALAAWLLASPVTLGYESDGMMWSDMASGALLLIFATMSLSHRMRLARWVCGAIGLWLLTAPLVFWASTAAAYLNGTLTGMLVMGFSVLVRPAPGLAPAAVTTGPTIPKGWGYSPSGWFQRLPIIILAVFGFLISRYLCAYQLGHIDAIWDPFFTGAIPGDGQNGTEEIITSSVSEAWPVPDAGLGALTYALEILTGVMGSARRWRTMPWLVLLFGIMIVPLGIVSIVFIIIQPVFLGTWCALCLIAAAAMLIQIPYSVDELVATCQFLVRRAKAGRPILRIFFTGDTDEGPWKEEGETFNQPASGIIREMLSGGITVPWTLTLSIIIGVWLMFTRLTLGVDGTQANMDHVIGALAITVAVSATAESFRAFRFLLVPLGAILLIGAFFTGAGWASLISSIVCGAGLVVLSIPRGPIANSYGRWDRFIK